MYIEYLLLFFMSRSFHWNLLFDIYLGGRTGHFAAYITNISLVTSITTAITLYSHYLLLLMMGQRQTLSLPEGPEKDNLIF